MISTRSLKRAIDALDKVEGKIRSAGFVPKMEPRRGSDPFAWRIYRPRGFLGLFRGDCLGELEADGWDPIWRVKLAGENAGWFRGTLDECLEHFSGGKNEI